MGWIAQGSTEGGTRETILVSLKLLMLLARVFRVRSISRGMRVSGGQILHNLTRHCDVWYEIHRSNE